MIKLQDFARECGVTDRAIQKHLKTYAEELEGLYERKGPNGTWLTDEACEILRSKMRQTPIVVGDTEIYRRTAELEREVKDLNAELKDAYKEQSAMLREIGELKGVQARLEASETARLALIEARDEFKDLAEKKDREAAEAHQEAARLRAELESVKNMNLFKWMFWKGK